MFCGEPCTPMSRFPAKSASIGNALVRARQLPRATAPTARCLTRTLLLSRAGFQGVDPTTDVRGARHFGLQCLVRAAERHRDDVVPVRAPYSRLCVVPASVYLCVCGCLSVCVSYLCVLPSMRRVCILVVVSPRR